MKWSNLHFWLLTFFQIGWALIRFKLNSQLGQRSLHRSRFAAHSDDWRWFQQAVHLWGQLSKLKSSEKNPFPAQKRSEHFSTYFHRLTYGCNQVLIATSAFSPETSVVASFLFAEFKPIFFQIQISNTTVNVFNMHIFFQGVLLCTLYHSWCTSKACVLFGGEKEGLFLLSKNTAAGDEIAWDFVDLVRKGRISFTGKEGKMEVCCSQKWAWNLTISRQVTKEGKILLCIKMTGSNYIFRFKVHVWLP